MNSAGAAWVLSTRPKTPSSKRLVALKFPPVDKLASEEDKARFVREAQAAAALNHPNICTVHEIDEADGHTFIAMPSRSLVRFYNKRGTAEQRIKAGKQATHWMRLSCHRSQGQPSPAAMVPKRSRREQCRPKRHSARSINASERWDEALVGYRWR